MQEVTRYLYRWYDPLRKKWFKSRIRLTKEELQQRYPDGYEILLGTEKTLQLRERKEFALLEANAIFLNDEDKAGTEAPETPTIKNR